MSTEFALHEKLEADTRLVADLPLCSCLLMDDARFPWLILVPRIPGLREFHEVPKNEQPQLLKEIERVSVTLQKISNAHKLNVAALGNQVPQLHIHVIARQTTDSAWPGPVWGVGTTEPYQSDARATFIQALQTELGTP